MYKAMLVPPPIVAFTPQSSAKGYWLIRLAGLSLALALTASSSAGEEHQPLVATSHGDGTYSLTPEEGPGFRNGDRVPSGPVVWEYTGQARFAEEPGVPPATVTRRASPERTMGDRDQLLGSVMVDSAGRSWLAVDVDTESWVESLRTYDPSVRAVLRTAYDHQATSDLPNELSEGTEYDYELKTWFTVWPDCEANGEYYKNRFWEGYSRALLGVLPWSKKVAQWS